MIENANQSITLSRHANIDCIAEVFFFLSVDKPEYNPHKSREMNQT